MLEAVGYGVCAVALIVAQMVVGAVSFSHLRPVETLPYLTERFVIVFLVVAIAVAPGIMAMSRVGVRACVAMGAGGTGRLACNPAVPARRARAGDRP